MIKIPFLNRTLTRQNILEIIRFLITGFAAFFIDLGLYYALFPMAGIGISKAASFLGATLFTFILNKFWTFKQSRMKTGEIVRFIAFYAVSMTLNNGVNQLLFYLTHIKLVGFLSATGVCMVFNFIGLKIWVFRKSSGI